MKSTTLYAALRAAVAAGLGGITMWAAAADVRVLMAIDPADLKGDVSPSTALVPAQSMSRALGQRATISQTGLMADAMRASRTVENEIIIAPAHVTASAILHAYQLVGTSAQEQVYALVVRNDIDQPAKLANRRLYLPQQDSLRSYLAKGMIIESGLTLAQFSKVTYGNTSGAGLVALMFNMADVTVATETEAKEWIAAHPGEGRILKTTRPVPSGLSIVVRKDFCATDCGRLAEWIASSDSSIGGLVKFRPAPADAGKQFTYVASLGITTPDAVPGVVKVGAEMIPDLARQDVVLIDTRSQKEYDSEHIRGAVLAPYLEKSLKEVKFDSSKDDFTAFANMKIDKARPILFLCNGPECWKSYKASRAAVQAGYTKVYWFRGGMPEWRDKHLPVEGSAMALAKVAAAPKLAAAKAVAAR